MGERERNINVWLLLAHPPLGTWPATQACALTGNRTRDPLAHKSALNPLSHTSQGTPSIFKAAIACHILLMLQICFLLPGRGNLGLLWQSPFWWPQSQLVSNLNCTCKIPFVIQVAWPQDDMSSLTGQGLEQEILGVHFRLHSRKDVYHQLPVMALSLCLWQAVNVHRFS